MFVKNFLNISEVLETHHFSDRAALKSLPLFPSIANFLDPDLFLGKACSLLHDAPQLGEVPGVPEVDVIGSTGKVLRFPRLNETRAGGFHGLEVRLDLANDVSVLPLFRSI